MASLETAAVELIPTKERTLPHTILLASKIGHHKNMIKDTPDDPPSEDFDDDNAKEKHKPRNRSGDRLRLGFERNFKLSQSFSLSFINFLKCNRRKMASILELLDEEMNENLPKRNNAKLLWEIVDSEAITWKLLMKLFCHEFRLSVYNMYFLCLLFRLQIRYKNKILFSTFIFQMVSKSTILRDCLDLENCAYLILPFQFSNCASPNLV